MAPNFDRSIQLLRQALAVYQISGKSDVEVIRLALTPWVNTLAEGLGKRVVAAQLRAMADEVERTTQ